MQAVQASFATGVRVAAPKRTAAPRAVAANRKCDTRSGRSSLSPLTRRAPQRRGPRRRRLHRLLHERGACRRRRRRVLAARASPYPRALRLRRAALLRWPRPPRTRALHALEPIMAPRVPFAGSGGAVAHSLRAVERASTSAFRHPALLAPDLPLTLTHAAAADHGDVHGPDPGGGPLWPCAVGKPHCVRRPEADGEEAGPAFGRPGGLHRVRRPVRRLGRPQCVPAGLLARRTPPDARAPQTVIGAGIVLGLRGVGAL